MMIFSSNLPRFKHIFERTFLQNYKNSDFFVHTIWTTLKFSIIMIDITISIKGFRLLPYVFMERTHVFLEKRVNFSILEIWVKHIIILHLFQPSMRGYIKCLVKY